MNLGANVTKLFAVIIYSHFMVIASFYKTFFCNNYNGMAVNYWSNDTELQYYKYCSIESHCNLQRYFSPRKK